MTRRCGIRRLCSLTPTVSSNVYHLAHMNYARMKANLEDPSMEEFRLAIEPVNQLARNTPGFVWSLDGSDDPLARQAVPLLHEDPLLMPQLSLWKDVASVQHFAYKSGHAMYWRRRKEWFTPPLEKKMDTKTDHNGRRQQQEPYTVCWWRPATASPPTLVEAFDRLDVLRRMGPTAEAFTLKTDFPAPTPRRTDDTEG